ncbi:hypothetical protein BT69DRAFT_1293064 [Atractiella rhizophila]|nr:hypothetical protein BT69DRAFT_1293064 [Atractiella rhizophila]
MSFRGFRFLIPAIILLPLLCLTIITTTTITASTDVSHHRGRSFLRHKSMLPLNVGVVRVNSVLSQQVLCAQPVLLLRRAHNFKPSTKSPRHCDEWHGTEATHRSRMMGRCPLAKMTGPYHHKLHKSGLLPHTLINHDANLVNHPIITSYKTSPSEGGSQVAPTLPTASSLTLALFIVPLRAPPVTTGSCTHVGTPTSSHPTPSVDCPKRNGCTAAVTPSARTPNYVDALNATSTVPISEPDLAIPQLLRNAVPGMHFYVYDLPETWSTSAFAAAAQMRSSIAQY